MGSQEVWHRRVNAPSAIVVDTPAGWFVAERGGGEQPDRSHGGMGPVVLTYTVPARSLPYRSKEAATGDALLILARDYDPEG